MRRIILYLILYFLLLIMGSVVLRYLVPSDYSKKGKLSPLIALLQGLVFFMYGGFPYIYLRKDWPAVSVPSFIHLSGASFVIIGLVLLLYGMVRLGVNNSFGRGTQELEIAGLYGVSRNPQAVACGMYTLGFFMLWPSWYALGWVLLYFVLIHMMVLAEEEHLKRKHGQKYQAYCEKVQRYLGRK